MKEQDLLNAMGDIREDFILEAEPHPGAVSAEQEKKVIPWKNAEREVSQSDPGDGGQAAPARGGQVTPVSGRYVQKAGILAAGLVLVIGFGVYQSFRVPQEAENAVVTEYQADEAFPQVSYSNAEQDAGIPAEEMAEDKTAGKAEEIAEDKTTGNTTGKTAAETEETAEDRTEDADDSVYEFEIAEEDMVPYEEELTLENADLPNLWITCATLEEAETIAGFSLKAPEADAEFSTEEIFAVADTLIEVRYVDADGREGYRIRKGVDTESADGDHDRYDTVYTLAVGEKEVTLKGNGSAIAVARWTDQGYSCSITADTIRFSEKEIQELIRNTK